MFIYIYKNSISLIETNINGRVYSFSVCAAAASPSLSVLYGYLHIFNYNFRPSSSRSPLYQLSGDESLYPSAPSLARRYRVCKTSKYRTLATRSVGRKSDIYPCLHIGIYIADALKLFPKSISPPRKTFDFPRSYRRAPLQYSLPPSCALTSLVFGKKK